MFFFFNDTATTEIYTLPYTTLFRSKKCVSISRSEASIWLAVATHGIENTIMNDVTSIAHTNSGMRLSDIPGARCFKDRKSTRLNSSHPSISYAVFCLKKKKKTIQ